MDLTTIIGLVATSGVVLFGIWLGGTGIAPYIDIPSVCITGVGGFMASVIQFPGHEIKRLPGVLRKAFVIDSMQPLKLISDLVKFAEVARKDGILALESMGDQITDSFLKRAVQLAVDGTDPDLVEDMMRAELEMIMDRHSKGRRMLDTLTSYFPTYGMAGTLIGLVAMLQNLSDVSVIGPAMAIALLTTFYGVLGAYLICQPLSKKLETKSMEESQYKEIIIQGVRAIQSGDNPRVVEQKLRTFLPPALRNAK